MGTQFLDDDKAIAEIKKICEESDGRSRFYAYGSSGYKDCVRHFLESSSEVARVGVQPGRVEDLSRIMDVLKRSEVPFAVKGGGHATSPGLSSTDGVQIYLSFFDRIAYDKETKRMTIGSGALFDQVYREAQIYDRNVVGGSASQGVGVGGWFLGGGYSLISNKYGLGIDRIVEIEVVLPSGDVVRADHNGPYKDLFFALKGGRNNFGIITEFVVDTVEYYKPQGNNFVYDVDKEERVKQAIANFVQNGPPQEAVVVAAFRYAADGDTPDPSYAITALCAYNGLPDGGAQNAFKEFEEIQKDTLAESDASRGGPDGDEDYSLDSRPFMREMDFLELDALFASNYGPHELLRKYGSETAVPDGSRGGPDEDEDLPIPTGGMSGVGELPRGRFGGVMISNFTKAFIDDIGKEAEAAAKNMREHGGQRVIIDVWPAHKHVFVNSPPAGYPHPADRPCGTMLAYFVWEGSKNDPYWLDKMGTALTNLKKLAIDHKCATPDLPLYSNMALETITTNPEDIWRENLYEVAKIRDKYDPEDVMHRGKKSAYRIPLTKELPKKVVL